MDNFESFQLKEPRVLNIHQRMNCIMKEVDYIKKREKKSGMLYSFVSHDDVSFLLHKPLAENGILPVINVLNYVIDGNKHSVKVKVDFVNVDSPQDFIAVEGWGYSIDDKDKGYGKAISYALKYIYLKQFVLESGDEDDVESFQGKDCPEPKSEHKKSPTPTPPAQLPKIEKLVVEEKTEPFKADKLNKDQIEEIRKLLNGNSSLKEEVLQFTNKKLVSDISQGLYAPVLNFIKVRLKQEQVI